MRPVAVRHSATIRKVLAYAGTPLPDRPPGNPQPGSGLCWWTNFDGVWPLLSRDAYAGAGAGNQTLLVVPCRNLIVVRNGEDLGDPAAGEDFWGGLEKHLFAPLVDAFVDRIPVSVVARESATTPACVGTCGGSSAQRRMWTHASRAAWGSMTPLSRGDRGQRPTCPQAMKKLDSR